MASTQANEKNNQERDLGLLPEIPPITATLGNRPPYVVYYQQPSSKVNLTTTRPPERSYNSLFTLTAPYTLRQPLYTAANYWVERSRRHWYDFYRYPVVYSAFGAPGPSTLNQLDDPIPAISISDITAQPVNMGSVQAQSEVQTLQEVSATYPTIYGAVRTTTFTTTISAEPGDVVYLKFPTATPAPPFEYTTRPAQTDVNSKDYPNGLPILVLTQVDGIVLNSLSTTLTTATIIQAVPPAFTTDPDAEKLELVSPSYKWTTWSSAERGGVIAATVLSTLMIITLIVYLCVLRKRHKRNDEEDKNNAGKDKGLVRNVLRWVWALRRPKRASASKWRRRSTRQMEPTGGDSSPKARYPSDEGIGMTEGGGQRSPEYDQRPIRDSEQQESSENVRSPPKHMSDNSENVGQDSVSSVDCTFRRLLTSLPLFRALLHTSID